MPGSRKGRLRAADAVDLGAEVGGEALVGTRRDAARDVHQHPFPALEPTHDGAVGSVDGTDAPNSIAAGSGFPLETTVTDVTGENSVNSKYSTTVPVTSTMSPTATVGAVLVKT